MSDVNLVGDFKTCVVIPGRSQYRSVKISARFFPLAVTLQSGRGIFQTVDGVATINHGTMYANPKSELFRQRFPIPIINRAVSPRSVAAVCQEAAATRP